MATAPQLPTTGPRWALSLRRVCSSHRVKATRPTYNLAGYPPAVKEGYIDGCETAKHSQYAHKDTKRMAEDPQYSMGWNDGFGICKKK